MKARRVLEEIIMDSTPLHVSERLPPHNLIFSFCILLRVFLLSSVSLQYQESLGVIGLILLSRSAHLIFEAGVK